MYTKKVWVVQDLISVPYDQERSLIYSPSAKAIALLPNEHVALLMSSASSAEALAYSEDAWPLIYYGFLTEYPPTKSLPRILHHASHTCGTLFLTTRCNLMCLYCYAAYWSCKDVDMPYEVGCSAVEYLIDNAKRLMASSVTLIFHGGGEPTCAWNTLKQLVLYAENRCRQEGIHLRTHLTTNGMMSTSQAQWISQHFKKVNVSLDGPREVQSYQRPARDGGDSYLLPIKTLQCLSKNRVKTCVRCTVTDRNVSLMSMLVEDSKRVGVNKIIFEPVAFSGRCEESGIQISDPLKFVTEFLKTKQYGRRLGVMVNYGGISIFNPRRYHCGADSMNFVVTPDGAISSCYHVSLKSHPQAAVFIYGTITDNGVSLDSTKRMNLSKIMENHLHFCKQCVARWTCAGGCISQRLAGRASEESFRSSCIASRLITEHDIREYFETAGDNQYFIALPTRQLVGCH